MNSTAPKNAPDEDCLGRLAMQFRGTRDEVERRAIAEEYSQTVERLVQAGGWNEMPTLEDQLPDEWMPSGFYEYWSPARATVS